MIQLFELPEDAFYPHAKPKSIILVEKESFPNHMPFFSRLYYDLKSVYCHHDGIYYHFSQFDCTDTKVFYNNKVLTINRSTGHWALRYPHATPYP